MADETRQEAACAYCAGVGRLSSQDRRFAPDGRREVLTWWRLCHCQAQEGGDIQARDFTVRTD